MVHAPSLHVKVTRHPVHVQVPRYLAGGVLHLSLRGVGGRVLLAQLACLFVCLFVRIKKKEIHNKYYYY